MLEFLFGLVGLFVLLQEIIMAATVVFPETAAAF